MLKRKNRMCTYKVNKYGILTISGDLDRYKKFRSHTAQLSDWMNIKFDIDNKFLSQIEFIAEYLFIFSRNVPGIK